MTTRRSVLCVACLWCLAASAGGFAQSQTTAQNSPAVSQLSTTPRAADLGLLVGQIREALKNPRRAKEVITLTTQVITSLSASGPVQRPEILLQAYEYRGHAHMTLGELVLAQKDYLSVLTINPDYQLNPDLKDTLKDVTTANFEIISGAFDAVKGYTLGRISLSLTPPGKVDIGGRTYDLNGERKTITLAGDNYPITISRPGYETLTTTIRIEPGKEAEPIDLKLERLLSTLSIVSTPPGAEIVLDSETFGRTARADGSATLPTIGDLQLASDTKTVVDSASPSSPALIPNLQPTKHTLVLRAPCYQDVTWDFTIARESEKKPGTIQPDDFKQSFKLTPATAKLKVLVTEPQATLFFDGVIRPVVPDTLTVCAGPHWIEVRGSLGRFIDRYDWKAGDERPLSGTLRSALAIVNTQPDPAGAAAQQKVLETLKDARALVYVPYERELADAIKEPAGVPDFWSSGTAATGGISPAGKLEQWSKLTQRLQAQGLAAVSTTMEPGTVVLSLLGPNSSSASNIPINTNDPASLRAARELLTAPPVRFWRPSLDLAVVDVEGVAGAMVARIKEGGAADKAELKPGDTIVSFDDTTVASATDLLNKLAGRAAGTLVQMQVKSLGSTDQRRVSITIAMAPDGDPSSRVPNLTLVDLQAALQRSNPGSIERAAAQLNLGIVHFTLGNLDEAKKAFDAVTTLSDGPGVSAGTLAYWKGLCLEKLGNPQEAHAQFEKAAAAPLARLSIDGPLVAPLAKLKLSAAGK